MVATPRSTTALKWWIAVELRRMREKSGITRAQAAAAIKGSLQNIGHFEVGRSLPGPLELDRLVELYGAPERADFYQELRTRAKRGRDWWVGMSGPIAEQFQLFLGLEASAVQIESWDAHVVPGLFQTRAYAEALVRGGRPDRPADDVARLVDLRMARQREVLDRDDPPQVWSVIAEPALRWLVGGPEVMREQLERLSDLARRSTVDIQVLPFSVGANAGPEGTFMILTPPHELENYLGCAYAEDIIGAHYYEEPEQLAAARNILNRLRVQAGKPESTPAYLRRLAKDM